MSIRILINGAQGNMGLAVVNAFKQLAEFDIVAAIDRRDDLAQTLNTHKPDIAIDFTSSDAVWDNAQTIIQHGTRPVIGSTGLSSHQIQTLQHRCLQQSLGGIIAPNFSIGAILMMKYAQDAARYFNDVEIIEYHHSKKIDAPSGTAIKTAEMIAQTRATQHHNRSKELFPGVLGATVNGISVHSIRLPGLVAHQSVIFGGEGQTLTFRHDAMDRSAYMPGIVLACKKVMELRELIYGLENIMT